MKKSIKYILAGLALSTALFLTLSSTVSLPPSESKAAALALVTLSFWATGVIPEYITSLLFFLLAMLFSLAPAEIIFSGFASTALWLVFSGLILGIAISSTGLGKRIATLSASRLQGSYPRIISGLVAAGVFFCVLMPSAMGRVVLLTPIAISLATHFGFKEGTKGRTGVILAVILGTFIPAFGILPANVPNMILVGMAETGYGISFLYGSYLLLHFPIVTCVKAILIVGLILFFFPDQPGRELAEEERNEKPFSRNEIILTAVLCILLTLWITDFIHHISPAWIALGGALFLLFPGINIVSQKQFNQKVNWGSLIFIAGILGMGSMISYSGLGNTLAKGIISLLPFEFDHTFVNYLSVSVAATMTGVATTLPGVPAVFTPLAHTLAEGTGLSVKAVLMMQVLGFSTVIFPYQAPPIVIGMQLSGEKFSSAARICMALSAITLILLLPVNYIWWRILGWL